MSTTGPRHDTASGESSAVDQAALSSDGGAQPSSAGAEAPPKRRNPWIWVCAVLGVLAAGLLIWALAIQSDLDSTEQDVANLQSQMDANADTGSAVLGGAKALYDDLKNELGTTSEDLATTQQDLDEAEQAGAQAQQEASAAKDSAAKADNATDKAKAEADQAKAEAKAAESKAATAADCANAYVAAFGSLFEGDSVRAQADVVRQQLEGITADCKAALSGG
jgi:uncharacterized protein YoxC